MVSGSPTTSSEAGSLSERFRSLRASRRCALIPYITAGYPDPGTTPALLDALVASGADIIELGVPFSDPVADGPTIQRSSQRALEQGVTLSSVLAVLRKFRQRHDTPVVLFTYLNPVFSHGVDRFVTDALAAGANGVLLTDLPVGGDVELEATFAAAGLPLIRLIAPTTSPARVRIIAASGQGFLYYVARTGVTGATASLRETLGSEVAAVRAVTDLPVAVGFGISSPRQAAEVARVADGVVIGSALIDTLDGGGIDGVAALLASIRSAMDEATRE
jgi:tryptophan synthase alpha chain